MRTTKKRTTNKRPDPVFSEKQQKAAVPLGMAVFFCRVLWHIVKNLEFITGICRGNLDAFTIVGGVKCVRLIP